jgi:hypothetical protein
MQPQELQTVVLVVVDQVVAMAETVVPEVLA